MAMKDELMIMPMTMTVKRGSPILHVDVVTSHRFNVERGNEMSTG
jgi:hypothetical protein